MLLILKTIVFCGKQNIALRGRREEGSTGQNPGNFQALLQFGIDSGDSVLANHFKECPRNAQYRSPGIQNELIACTGEWIRKRIIQEVVEARFFSVCADEASDVSNKEQLPLVIRFVDKTNSIREEFVVCDTGTTGVALAGKILEALESYGLDLHGLCGQGYDGAGNMAGKCRGAAACIQASYPKAVFVHCAAHSLNLCVVAACSIQEIKNMMGILVEICLFYANSPKRQHELELQVQAMENNSSTRGRLVSMCKTRWVARIDALEVFNDLFSAVVNTFETIGEGQSSGWNSDSARVATALLSTITQFKFIFAFVVALKGLGYLKGLTKSLQKRAKDICNAYSEVVNVQKALQNVRDSIDTNHKAWFDAALALGQKVNATAPQLPRRCSRQTARNNVPGDSPELYFKRIVSIPFMDELLAHLDQRFSDVQRKAIKGMSIIPSVVNDSSVSQSSLSELLEFYGELHPSPLTLDVELHLWECKWRSYNADLPDTPQKALEFASSSMYPNIYTLL